MTNKKGTFETPDIVYWFIYLPMTAVVVLALFTIPSAILDTSVQPMALDATIMNERIAQKLTKQSPIYGVQYDELVPDVRKAMTFYLSDKKYGYRVTVNGVNYYSNKDFYDDAAPLAPIKYDIYASTNVMYTPQGPVTVETSQVFPKRYEKAN